MIDYTNIEQHISLSMQTGFDISCAIKNHDLTYLWANQNYLSLLGITENNLIEKSDKDLPIDDIASNSDHYQAMDKAVIQQQRPQQYMNVIKYSDGDLHLHLSLKTPYFDNKNTLRGVLGIGFPIYSKEMLNQLNTILLTKAHNDRAISGVYTVTSTVNYLLTPREQECLFWLLRGLTAKDIGEKLEISFRTVEIHISNIKNKYSCDSKSALIAYAYEQQLHRMIPQSLLSSISSKN